MGLAMHGSDIDVARSSQKSAVQDVRNELMSSIEAARSFCDQGIERVHLQFRHEIEALQVQQSQNAWDVKALQKQQGSDCELLHSKLMSGISAIKNEIMCDIDVLRNQHSKNGGEIRALQAMYQSIHETLQWQQEAKLFEGSDSDFSGGYSI